MLRRDVIRSLMIMPLTGWLRPWVPWAFAGAVDPERNAADVYAKAFAWAHRMQLVEAERMQAELEGLQPVSPELLSQAVTVPLDDPRVDGLLREARPALASIREAAAVGRCRWAIEVPTNEELLRGHLDPANTRLIRIACLSARRHARAGRGREALDDLFAGLTLAHRLGENGPLIAHVLESAGEIVAFAALGRILPELDRESREDLSHRLDALPPPQPASAVIGPESRYILGTIRKELRTLGPVIDDEGWIKLGFAADQPGTEAIRRLTGNDHGRLLAHLDAAGAGYDELARRLDFRWRECRVALDEFVRTQRAAQPLATGLVESAWARRVVLERVTILRAMARAGVALVASGEAAFRAIANPLHSGPFELERRGGHFLIRSPKDEFGMPEVRLGIGDVD